MSDNWEILPESGLGPLRFGMSEAEARPIAQPLYGEIEAEGPAGLQSNDEVYQVLLETMGEEAAREAIGPLKKSGVDLQTSRRINFVSGLMLDFVEDGLDSIMCHSAALALHVGGKPFFGVDPLPALRQLQQLNGEPPFVKGPDCYFSNIEVTAFECLLLMPGGGFRATREGTEEAGQKTVGWQRKQRTPPEDLTGHVRLDLAT
ncbi:hypothetical protein BYZ73_10080 [Rhodovulum viride]|uniref:Uncharacterized protein n=1 Tax=Rhodovulum viride TaxID=1231134 RepID=A0ABX9DGV6_9RHOB|nr:hypothetical protein [Rhodovulum viride]RAP41596.1 hypothetical protein BYZ73_10080 [Rhodovulum viride]